MLDTVTPIMMDDTSKAITTLGVGVVGHTDDHRFFIARPVYLLGNTASIPGIVQHSSRYL